MESLAEPPEFCNIQSQTFDAIYKDLLLFNQIKPDPNIFVVSLRIEGKLVKRI